MFTPKILMYQTDHTNTFFNICDDAGGSCAVRTASCCITEEACFHQLTFPEPSLVSLFISSGSKSPSDWRIISTQNLKTYKISQNEIRNYPAIRVLDT